MNKISTMILILFAILFLICGVRYSKAEMTEDGIEVIVFELVPTPTPEPPKFTPPPTPTPAPIEINEHNPVDADIEVLARLLWSSPLRNREYKAALCWVVLNRVDNGGYGSTIQDVVNKTEFAFYDRRAHLSDENKEIAKLVLNQWHSEKDGLNAGRLVPKNGLFIRFDGENNRKLEVTAERGGNPLQYMDGAYNY